MAELRKTINTYFASSPVFTSELTLQAGERLNISIRPGVSFVQEPTASTVSAVFTLQRQLPGDSIFRTVETWTVLAASGIGAEVDNITVSPEPEWTVYRLGVLSGEYYAGGAWGRLGVGGTT